MDSKPANWVAENKLVVSESQLRGSDIIEVPTFGKFIYLKAFDGKLIDDDFSFILTDEEFDLVDKKEDVNYILFEFGTKFYYSNIIKTKNKYNEIVFKPEFNDFKFLGSSAEPHILDFVHLGVHSEYEILNGSGSCQLWANKAKFLGQKTLGICDKNTLAAALSFQTACEKNGLKFILGETVTVAKDYSEDKENQETFELKFYAKDKAGWKNLLLINRAVNVDYQGFIPEDLIYEYSEGLCLVIPKESELNYNSSNKEICKKLIKKYKANFEDVYYQIDTVEYTSESLFKKHLQNIDSYILNYSRILKPILINDSYYLDKENGELKSMLNKIDGKVNAESITQYYKSFQDTLDSYSEWVSDVDALFQTILLGVENTNELACKCDFKINTSERKLPLFEVNDVKTWFCENYKMGFTYRCGHLRGNDFEKF